MSSKKRVKMDKFLSKISLKKLSNEKLEEKLLKIVKYSDIK